MISETSSAPPTCNKHGEQMVLTFFERPGSPPGNNWICRSCATVRAYGQSTARVASSAGEPQCPGCSSTSRTLRLYPTGELPGEPPCTDPWHFTPSSASGKEGERK